MTIIFIFLVAPSHTASPQRRSAWGITSLMNHQLQTYNGYPKLSTSISKSLLPDTDTDCVQGISKVLGQLLSSVNIHPGESHRGWEVNTVVPPYLWGLGTQDLPRTPNSADAQVPQPFTVNHKHNARYEDVDPMDVEG